MKGLIFLSYETLNTVFNVMMYTIVFLFGITIGSFLNVCILRLPRGESLVKSNSHCMTCGAQIKWYDLIPVLSWLLLRGKCRNCGEKISPRYCIVESLTGIMFIICYAVFPYQVYGLYFALLALFLSGEIVLAFQDYDNQEMCVSVIVYTFIIALLTHILSYIDLSGTHILAMPEELRDYIVGMLCISVPMLILGFVITPFIYNLFISQDRKDKKRLEKALKNETNEGKRRQITVKLDRAKENIKEEGLVFGFGMGDILIMAIGGLMLGWKAAVVGAAAAIILGAVYALYKAAVSDEKENKFAFGPFLIIGLAIGAYAGDLLVNSYIAHMGF